MTVVGAVALFLAVAAPLLANGGPFVLKYPGGDPAAKGVLARLDPDLRPGTETRLRVIKEDLKIAFETAYPKQKNDLPLARVSAEYTIENPTDSEVEVDFGFPIVRGIYTNPYSMMPTPDVSVHLGTAAIVDCTIISNSAIYGIVRQRARAAIEKAVAVDPVLNALVQSVRGSTDEALAASRKALRAHLRVVMKWNERDADLMVEYAGLDLGQMKVHPADRHHIDWGFPRDEELRNLANANLGPLGAIGEQKATQFFAQLASLFDPKAAAAYETIFTAWGGDVRELAVDLETGKLRPREITVDANELDKNRFALGGDPTVYARVDYLDPQAQISESEKESCKAILKNLPVVFTFAPMNILHYRVKFPPKSTQTLTVEYSQHAYSDTRSPASYQLAYVVHPASLWKDFGPINLEVKVPEGVKLRASDNAGMGTIVVRKDPKTLSDVYLGTLKGKTGEIYLALDADLWNKNAPEPKPRF